MRIFRFAALVAVASLVAIPALAAPAAAKPQDRYAQNGAVKIHYMAEGKGPLVVMIHGFPDY